MEKKKNTETKMSGYKVLVMVGKKLVSPTKSGLKCQYITDKFVSPRRWGGPLTAFTEKEMAIYWAGKQRINYGKENVRVYRCEYIPTLVKHVWRYRYENLKSKPLSELPENTVLAKRIKITKRVAY